MDLDSGSQSTNRSAAQGQAWIWWAGCGPPQPTYHKQRLNCGPWDWLSLGALMEQWSTRCLDGAVERVVLGWMRWSAWHLSGRGGEVPGWTRGRIWSLSGQGGAPEFYLFSQVTSDEVQEGSVKAEGGFPSLGVGYSHGFIIGR